MNNPRIAACPFVRRGDRLCVVLVTGRRHGAWLLPKGRPESDLIARQVAELEAWEEAGVVGQAHGRPSRFQVPCQSGDARPVVAYPIQVKSLSRAWPEQHQRVRRVVPIEALHTVPMDDSWRRCIRRLARRI